MGKYRTAEATACRSGRVLDQRSWSNRGSPRPSSLGESPCWVSQSWKRRLPSGLQTNSTSPAATPRVGCKREPEIEQHASSSRRSYLGDKRNVKGKGATAK